MVIQENLKKLLRRKIATDETPKIIQVLKLSDKNFTEATITMFQEAMAELLVMKGQIETIG